MPRLVFTDEKGGEAERVVITLVGDARVTIGRGSTCDVVLSGPGIGRLHATVELSGGKLLVRHPDPGEGCIHGIWVDGSTVEEAMLGDGDEFRIGDYVARVDLAETVEARPHGAGRVPGQGNGGEATPRGGASEDAPHRRQRAPPRREVLGGVKLSKTQQTIIKIVCAGVMLVCIVFIVALIEHILRKR